MTIDDMYRVRQLIGCVACSDNDLDLCRKLLTPEQRNEYAAKYGRICGCSCKYCKLKEECVEDRTNPNS